MRGRSAFLSASLALALSICGRAAFASSIDDMVWTGDTSGAFQCRDADCMVGAMTRSGAKPEAIDFARTYTALRQGRPAWATGFAWHGLQGLMGVVTTSCAECRAQHFVIVTIPPTGPVITDPAGFGRLFESRLEIPSIKTAHPNAVLMYMGEGFLSSRPLKDGGVRLIFINLVADCEACQPFTALKYAIDFSKGFRSTHSSVLGFVPVAATQHAVMAGGSGE